MENENEDNLCSDGKPHDWENVSTFIFDEYECKKCGKKIGNYIYVSQ